MYLSSRDEFWHIDFPEELNIYYLKPISRAYSFLPFDIAKRRVKFDFPADKVYDLAVDFNSYQCSCAVGALTVPAKYRVMWVHNNVQIKLKNEWKYRVLWSAFKGKFKYYDEFIPVSAAIEAPFRAASGIDDKPCTVIQNVIDVAEIREKMQEMPEGLELDPSCLNFVALGKLCHQKGYDIMLSAFAAAMRERGDIRLYIIGDGPDMDALIEQRDKLGLTDKVTFLGKKSNPYCYMAAMDAFISTSRYEGQPLNIMEAMAVGLPLYCTKNLESYTEGLTGYDDIAAAIVNAKKETHKPDGLVEYNQKILNSIYELTERA